MYSQDACFFWGSEGIIFIEGALNYSVPNWFPLPSFNICHLLCACVRADRVAPLESKTEAIRDCHVDSEFEICF
jgi:hypothetical protein